MTIQLAKLKDSFFFISKMSSKPKAVYRGFQVVPSYCSRIVSDLCVCVHIRPCSSRNCVSLGHGAVVFQSFPFYMECLLSYLSAPSRTDGTSASVRATAQAHAPGLIASHSLSSLDQKCKQSLPVFLVQVFTGSCFQSLQTLPCHLTPWPTACLCSLGDIAQRYGLCLASAPFSCCSSQRHRFWPRDPPSQLGSN